MRRLSGVVGSGSGFPYIGRKRRVVVTGIGIVSPLGNTLADSWETICGGNKSNSNSNGADSDWGVTTLEKALALHQDLDPDRFEEEWRITKSLPCQVVAPVRGLHEAIDDASSSSSWNPRTTPRFVQMALLAGSQAMNQANLINWLKEDHEDSLDRGDRFGVCVGSGMSSVREISTSWDLISKTSSIRRLSPHFVPKVLTNSAAGRLSLEYGLKGPNLAPSTACAASAHAIGDGLRAIQNGACDLMLVGGAEASIEPLGLAGFCRLRALSTSFNDRPKEASRPFDGARDGFVMGEGAAVLVLEELEHAKQRFSKNPSGNGRILAEITGYAASGDAFHVTAPDEAGRGAERAMVMALEEDKSFHPNDFPPIGYINAHATSTPKGDQIEASVVDRVLRSSAIQNDAESECYLSSTKGLSGHLLGAAGALEAAFTIMSLVDQKIPPTVNLDEPETNDDQPWFQHVVGNQALQPSSDVQMAISNSFGFGGTNASLVFRRYSDNGKEGTVT